MTSSMMLTLSAKLRLSHCGNNGAVTKLLWVHTKLEEKAMLQQRAPDKEFVDGEGFLYLGKSYRLRLIDRQLVDLHLRNGRFCLRRSSVHRGREVFVSWYARRAQQWFERQVTLVGVAKRGARTLLGLTTGSSF